MHQRLAITVWIAASGFLLGACQANVPDRQSKNPIEAPATTGTALPQDPLDPTAIPPLSQLVAEPLVMRRLTRQEFDHSIRDVLGQGLGFANRLPPEELNRGFSNNANALTFSLQLAEGALSASQQVASYVSARLNAFLPCAATSPGTACATEFIQGFGAKIFRRPVSAEELAGLQGVFEKGNQRSFARGIELVVSSLVVAAPFWYRVEFGDGQQVPGKPGLARPTSYEMATRLSYLAWNSTPDDTLLALAAQDALKSPDQVSTQFERLLADPRAKEAVASFQTQWLDVGRLESINKDPQTFPQWSGDVRASLRTELELLLERAAWDSASGLSDLFTTSQSFANAQVAEFYGIPAPSGSGFSLVSLPPAERGGLLTRAGFLAYEGFDKTSPVRRGAFIRRSLLCQDPPPPPKDIPLLPVGDSTTERERLKEHTANPACQGCHKLMDPVGLGLESYDAIGRYRTEDGGKPIDATGLVLFSDIDNFNGLVELGQKMSVSEEVRVCFAQQWYRFAYGRSPSSDRFQSVQKLADTLRTTGGSYQALLRQLVTLDEFLYRPL